MLTPLIAVAPNAVLPGAANIGPNTAVVLQTNPEAIAAYMAGVNTAASQLFNWRGVPTDRRKTFFQSFWAAGSTDINPIDSWQGSITDCVTSPPELVLAIRAELFRRYPTTLVYAVGASSTTTPNPATPYQPTFTATLPPDLMIYGFQLPTNTGVFFALQEHFAETRFGSDSFPPSTSTAPYWSWNEFSTAVTNQNQDSACVASAAWQPPTIVYIGAGSLIPTS
jgi:hypothetical protein